MSSRRTILAFFVNKVPILRFSASYTFSFILVRRLFWTDASVLVVAEDMGILAFHTLSGFRNPEVWRITFNAKAVWS